MDYKFCSDCGKGLNWENTTLCIKCKQPICEDCFEGNKMKCKKCSPKKEVIKLDHIRRSHIETYRSCPYAFKLEVIEGIKPDPHPLAQLGIDLHDLYEAVQREEKSMAQVYSETSEIIASYEYDDELKEQMFDRAMVCNENFERLLPTLVNKAIAYEERLFFDVGEGLPQVTIAYDRLEEDSEGELHILDWKTGKAMSGKKLTTDLQPALYIHAVKKKYGKSPKSFRLIYLSDTYVDGSYKEKVFERLNDNEYVCKVGKKEYIQNINEQIKSVQKTFGLIKQGFFSIPEKTIGFKCDICHFKKIGKCQGQVEQSFLNANNNFVW